LGVCKFLVSGALVNEKDIGWQKDWVANCVAKPEDTVFRVRDGVFLLGFEGDVWNSGYSLHGLLKATLLFPE
jgi:hypothetical protein